MVASTWSRKLDYVYLAFFLIHIPVMLAVDFAGFYPASIRPTFTLQIRDYYIDTYRDRFFIDPPLWFRGFMVLELVYHLPLSLWAIPAILRDDALVPLQLLVFALETAVTTLTCTLEMLSWEGYSVEEQSRLCALYVPYLALAILMGADMLSRLRRTLLAKSKVQ